MAPISRLSLKVREKPLLEALLVEQLENLAPSHAAKAAESVKFLSQPQRGTVNPDPVMTAAIAGRAG